MNDLVEKYYPDEINEINEIKQIDKSYGIINIPVYLIILIYAATGATWLLNIAASFILCFNVIFIILGLIVAPIKIKNYFQILMHNFKFNTLDYLVIRHKNNLINIKKWINIVTNTAVVCYIYNQAFIHHWYVYTAYTYIICLTISLLLNVQKTVILNNWVHIRDEARICRDKLYTEHKEKL